MGLDTRDALIAGVSGTFSSVHARALSHATEDIEKVRMAMLNVFGDVGLEVSRTEGHHGNPISILEANFRDARTIDEFFRRLPDEDIEAIIETLGKRVDDGCNLFLKLDKQQAFSGSARLGSGDDVMSVRAKVRSYPAKCEVAQKAVREYLMALLESRGGGA